MDKKRLIKIGCIVIGVFLALALLESGIRALTGVINDVSQKREEKKQEEKVYNSDEEKVKRQIMTFLDDIFDAIKDKDYTYVYDSLDETYREYLFHDEVTTLEEYIKEKITIGDSYEYIRFNQKGDMYQVLVGMTNGGEYSSLGVTVKVIDQNRCTILFDEYEEFRSMDKIASYPNMQYQLAYYYETPNVMGYVMDIQNLSENDAVITFDDKANLIMTSGKNYQSSKLASTTVKAKESSRVEINFLKQFGGKSYLKLNLKENDVSKQVLISLEEDIM